MTTAVEVSAILSKTPASIAPQIPQELFYNILGYLQVLDHCCDDFTKDERISVLASKRELGQCALVCRFWAEICHPKVFYRITLRRQQDYIELLTLVSSPHSKIGVYTMRLSLQTVIGQEPWIQSIFSRTYITLLTKVDMIDLTLIGPGSERSVQSISPHLSLPRQVPVSCSSDIKILSLANVKCGSLRDVLQIATSLPSLVRLDCGDVSWAIPPSLERDPDLMRSHRRKPLRCLRLCGMYGCVDGWAALPLVVTLRRHPSFNISHEDLLASSMIPRALMSDWQHADSPYRDLRVEALMTNGDGRESSIIDFLVS